MNNKVSLGDNIIFKYDSSENLEKIIKDLSLKFNSASNFNDSFENRYQYIYTSESQIVDRIFNVRKLADSILDGMKISCFSETATDSLMWAHYANKHRGVCYCFGIKNLFQAKKYHFHFMQYTNNLPKLSFIEGKTSNFSLLEQMRDVVLTKSSSWAHEKEIRCIVDSYDVIHKYEASALEAVIIGCKVSVNELSRIEDFIKGHNERNKNNINIYYASMSYDDYSLEISKIPNINEQRLYHNCGDTNSKDFQPIDILSISEAVNNIPVKLTNPLEYDD